MTNKTRGYTPTGPTTVSDDFYYWGEIPDGYRVTIEIRDLQSERDNGYVWSDGWHRVVVTGPQPRPRTKTFIGEMAWADARRYAGDCVDQLQRDDRS